MPPTKEDFGAAELCEYYVNRSEFFTRQPFAIRSQQPLLSMMSNNPLIV